MNRDKPRGNGARFWACPANLDLHESAGTLGSLDDALRVAHLERVHEPGFGEALTIARRGKDEWSIGDAEADPANVARLRAALAKVEEGTIAGDRAIDALPLMVAWLQGDPDFPRASFLPIYSMLLTMFAIGSRRGRPIYESTGLLTRALLSVGLATDAYKELLGDVSELMGSGLGAALCQ